MRGSTVRGRCGAVSLLVAVAAMGFFRAEVRAADAPVLAEIECEPSKVCRIKDQGLALRVLARPFSNLYKSADAAPANIAAENIAAFKPMYVFARDGVDYADPVNPKGWYQVGEQDQAPTGWVQAKDALEWQQALLVSYTHPGSGDEARKPVLGFDSFNSLKSVVESPDRAAGAAIRYDALSSGQKPEGVVTSEPSGMFLDIDETFYIYPVLSWKAYDGLDEAARYLQVVSSTPGARASAPAQFTLDNPEVRSEIAGGGAVKMEVATRELSVAVVFVMDLTTSMGPFVDATKSAINKLATDLEKEPATAGKIKFGLVGYRDNVTMFSDMEFTAKNFTPKLLDRAAFADVISAQVKATELSSRDYQEEVFAGVKEALNSAWGDSTIRLIILVGDASSHVLGHPQNTTGLDEAGIRRLVTDANASLIALHLKDEEDKDDWDLASKQFSVLAKNPGTERPALVGVNARQPAEYEESIKAIAGEFIALFSGKAGAVATTGAPATPPGPNDTPPAPTVTNPADGASALTVPGTQGAAAPPGTTATPQSPATGTPATGSPPVTETPPVNPTAPVAAGPVDPAARMEVPTPPPAVVPANAAVADAKSIASRIAANAMVDYLGNSAEAPRDVTFWVFDHDLVNPEKQSVGVRVLISRGQMDSFIRSLESVLGALKENTVTGVGFMKALQSIVASRAKGEELGYEGAKSLSETPLMPKWIASLPYRSRVMSLSDAQIEQLTPDERATLEKDIEGLMALYKEIMENATRWKLLNEKDADLDRVYPLPIEQMP